MLDTPDVSLNPPDELRILGTFVTPFLDYNSVITAVEQVIEHKSINVCVAVNPEKAFRAMSDPDLATLLNSCEIKICDGVGIALAAWLLHGRWITRITGVGLFERLVSAAEEKGWSVFLLGASHSVSESAARQLRERHPSLVIAGCCDGYFQDSRKIVARINSVKPDMLFVAMGSPKQEAWLREYHSELAVPFRMGIGGTLDVVSGQVRRAPRIAQLTGTEWLYRLVSQPSRWRRQLALPKFAWLVIRESCAAVRNRDKQRKSSGAH